MLRLILDYIAMVIFTMAVAAIGLLMMPHV